MIKQTANQKIKKTTIEQAIEKLQAIPEKPKEEVSLREAIELMQPTLKQMMERGYNHDEVAEMLKGTGIQISGATLKQYLGARKERKPVRARDNQSNKSEDSGGTASRKSGKVIESIGDLDGKQSSKDDYQKEGRHVHEVEGKKEAKLIPKPESGAKIKKAQSSQIAEDEFNSY